MQKYSKIPLSYDELTSFKCLLNAHMVARANKKHKKDVIDFELDLAKNLVELEKSLKDKTYVVSGYKKFLIFEPKRREIQALEYRDRIVQHTICDNYLTPYYKNRLIDCNCACQENKGAHFARKKMKSFFDKFYRTNKSNKGYILKCDLKKFFASIDHQVLKNHLQKLPDKNVVELLYKIIDSYNADTGVGLPIGNQTSQIFGVVLLDKIDRIVKEKLRIKFYIRYMDDLILIHKDKEYLKICLKVLVEEVSKMKLQFNEKTQIIPIKNGVEFLGGRFYLLPTGKIIIKPKKQSKQRINKNLKALKYLFDSEFVEADYVQSSIGGYKGHLKQFNCFHLKQKIKFFMKDVEERGKKKEKQRFLQAKKEVNQELKILRDYEKNKKQKIEQNKKRFIIKKKLK